MSYATVTAMQFLWAALERQQNILHYFCVCHKMPLENISVSVFGTDRIFS